MLHSAVTENKFIFYYSFKLIFSAWNYLFTINEMGVLLRHLSFLYSWCSNHHHLYPFTLLNRHVYHVYTDNLNARILTLFIILKVWYANSFQKKIANFSNKNITLKVLCELTSKIIVLSVPGSVKLDFNVWSCSLSKCLFLVFKEFMHRKQWK